MKDLQARLDIDRLQRSLLEVKSKVDILEYHLDRQTHLEDHTRWDYGVGNIYKFEFPVVEILKMLLDQFGLKVIRQVREEKTLLVEKEGKNGEN